jgi:hypothetical protein
MHSKVPLAKAIYANIYPRATGKISRKVSQDFVFDPKIRTVFFFHCRPQGEKHIRKEI